MSDQAHHDDGDPIMHKSGTIQAHIDGELVTFPVPKIGQLKRLRDAHHAANDAHRAVIREFADRQQALVEKLDVLRVEMEAQTDDDKALAAVTEARGRLAEIQNEIDDLTREGQRAGVDEQERVAAEWFRTAAKDLIGRDLPDADDLPVWMGRLGSVRSFVEHWMTHPSPRGV